MTSLYCAPKEAPKKERIMQCLSAHQAVEMSIAGVLDFFKVVQHVAIPICHIDGEQLHMTVLDFVTWYTFILHYHKRRGELPHQENYKGE